MNCLLGVELCCTVYSTLSGGHSLLDPLDKRKKPGSGEMMQFAEVKKMAELELELGPFDSTKILLLKMQMPCSSF